MTVRDFLEEAGFSAIACGDRRHFQRVHLLSDSRIVAANATGENGFWMKFTDPWATPLRKTGWSVYPDMKTALICGCLAWIDETASGPFIPGMTMSLNTTSISGWTSASAIACCP
jgi:hypothetical protein